jgi:ATP-dependent Clp protease ATP-binding subunit ClpC
MGLRRAFRQDHRAAGQQQRSEGTRLAPAARRADDQREGEQHGQCGQQRYGHAARSSAGARIRPGDFKRSDEQVRQVAGDQPTVDEEEIAQVVAMWTGIPVTRIAQEESERLLQMEDQIHQRVIGQQEAIATISRP